MEQVLEKILDELKGLKAGQERMETRMEGLETRMESLETRMESLENRMEGLESRMDKLESRMDHLEEKVNDVEKKVDEQKSSIIQGLAPYFENIQKHIDEKFKKHQELIDVLSARSIQHEADIKSLYKLAGAK
ncbi:hypothetical protein [Heyndrickxia acidiproducens]|uniref:hypothetical protein n=1 Tax=Heyndrickxia acidiproducens TaxID=1121084 RepID=UPI0003642712|nr:hypothetical protein [Heyndrickxia acidiproducens]